LLGRGSLPEREWDHANGYKQNQVKGTSKKMRSNHGVNTLFHFDRAPRSLTSERSDSGGITQPQA
jgi:hypothetical protein